MILDLSRFITPKPLIVFRKKEILGLNTHFGRVIECEEDDFQFLLMPKEPYADHRSSLDYLKGI